MVKHENGLVVGLLGPDLSLRLSFVPVNGRALHGTDHRRRYSWHVLVCKVQLSKITMVDTVSQLFRVHSELYSECKAESGTKAVERSGNWESSNKTHSEFQECI